MIQFDEFRLDRGRYELLRQGNRIKLEKVPMELLILLVEKNGQLVTRQEIIQHVWGADVFLDTEHGINTAIRKVRNALRDDPEQPRFVQTVTGKGYRFIAPTTSIGFPPSGSADAEAVESGPIDALAPPPANGAGRALTATPATAPAGRRIFLLGSAVVLLLGSIGIAAVVLALNVAGLRTRFFGPSDHRIHSLAVLPLENLSGDPAQDYFADGMTDELTTLLAKNSNLRVISRTSAMRYKKTSHPLPQIARELGVDGILEGSVGRSGGRVHVNAQLIYAPSDSHLWAESYDRDLSDIGALQHELARMIARQVGSTLSGPAAPQRRISPEAYDAYLLGRYYWNARKHERSRQFFQKAIDLQPDYAAAWAGYADTYIASAARWEALPKTVMPEGEKAARKALELDDSSAEAHLSLAAVYLFYRWDWAGAESESARALELNPGFAQGHRLRADVLQVLGRTEEAVREHKKAMELDPFVRPWALTMALIQARQFDAALNEARLRSEAQPNNAGVRQMLGEAYWHKGMEKEAAKEWETSFQLAGKKDSALALHQAFERDGVRAVLEWFLGDFRKQVARGYVSQLEFAEVYACMKRKEEALHHLELAYQERAPGLVHVPNNSNYDFLHSEPRYQAIMKKMGLPAVQ